MIVVKFMLCHRTFKLSKKFLTTLVRCVTWNMTVSNITSCLKSFWLLYIFIHLFSLVRKFDSTILLVLCLVVGVSSAIPTFESVNGVDDINFRDKLILSTLLDVQEKVLMMIKRSINLKEQCHDDFVALGQFVLKSLLWGFYASVKLRRRYRMNFIRDG